MEEVTVNCCIVTATLNPSSVIIKTQETSPIHVLICNLCQMLILHLLMESGGCGNGWIWEICGWRRGDVKVAMC
jgi:hypothetical protein